MQSRDFCYWLQGFFELGDRSDHITAEQATIIKRHLDLVFAHELHPMARERPAHAPEPVTHPAPRPAPAPGPPPEDSPPRLPPEPPRC